MATPKRFFSKNGLCRSLFFFLKAFALSLFFSSHAGTIKKLEGKKKRASSLAFSIRSNFISPSLSNSQKMGLVKKKLKRTQESIIKPKIISLSLFYLPPPEDANQRFSASAAPAFSPATITKLNSYLPGWHENSSQTEGDQLSSPPTPINAPSRWRWTTLESAGTYDFTSWSCEAAA